MARALGSLRPRTGVSRLRRPWQGWLGAQQPRGQSLEVQTADGVCLAVERIFPAENRERRGPVLLLHGLAANRHVFHFPGRSLAAELAARGYDCFVPELRGAGRSGDAGRPWGIDDHLDRDIPALLEYILDLTGASRLHWIGHSLGGVLYMMYALDHPDAPIASGLAIGSALDYTVGESDLRALLPGLRLTTRLATRLPTLPWGDLVHWVAPAIGQPWLRRFEEFLAVRSNIEPELLQSVMANVFNGLSPKLVADLATTFGPGGFRRAGRAPYLERCREMSVPTLLVAGSGDQQCPLEATEHTARLLSGTGARLALFGRGFGQVDDYGHFDLILGSRAPREVWPRISAWLDSKPVV